jgi:hypothetical protein
MWILVKRNPADMIRDMVLIISDGYGLTEISCRIPEVPIYDNLMKLSQPQISRQPTLEEKCL